MEPGWIVDESELALRDEAGLATVFSLGNGATCTRGTRFHDGSDATQGVFVAGSFTPAPRGYGYFMDAPDWLPVRLERDGTVLPARPSRRILDMRDGVLTCRAAWSIGGKRVEAVETRFVSFAREWVCGQRIELRVPRGTPAFELCLAVDGDVRSDVAKYFKGFKSAICDGRSVRITEVEEVRADGHRLTVGLRALGSATRARASFGVMQTAGRALPLRHQAGRSSAAVFFAVSGPGRYVFEKLGVVTADIPGRFDCRRNHARAFAALRGRTWAATLREHTAAVRDFWRYADVRIAGDATAQQATRFAVWSTRIAAPDDGGATSIGARNLNGDFYRGMVFWDVDVFQFPMLAAVAPRQALNHLMNRARFLPEARLRARRDGYAGASYPFTTVGLDYERCESDFCYLEIHINLAIAWAILHYDTLAADRVFFERHGLAVLAELCRYWVTRVATDPDGTCHIRNVCGPDEFRRKGCDDNAYTNAMTAWALRITAERAARVPAAVRRRLAIAGSEMGEWRRVAERLYIPGDRARGLIEQCAGFFALPEPDFRLNGGRWGMLDRTLKQADVLLLWQMRIPVPGAAEDPGLMLRCWHEYAPICHHLSSLSNCSHALAAIELRRRNDALQFFRRTAEVDLADGNSQGTHGAGEGGLWMAVVHGFGGLHVRPGEGVEFDPILPPGWTRLTYRTRVAGGWCEVDVRRGRFTVRNLGGAPVAFRAAGRVRELARGAVRSFPVRAEWVREGVEGVILPVEGCLEVLVGAPRSAAARRLRRRIDAWNAAGVTVGVVSARRSVPRFLRRAGLDGRVAAWADASCVQKLPPASDLYDVICMRLRRLPWNCRAVDVQGPLRASARAAGIR